MTNYSNIWTQSNCLSKSQLIGYINQTLDRDEVYLIESHLNDCLICSDALDGLMDADIEQTQQDIHQIKQDLEEQIKLLHPQEKASFKVTQGNKNNTSSSSTSVMGATTSHTGEKFKWLVAASILGIIALGGYSVYSFIKSQDQMISKKHSSGDAKDAEYNPPPVKNDNEITTLRVNPPDPQAAPSLPISDEKKSSKDESPTTPIPVAPIPTVKSIARKEENMDNTKDNFKELPKQFEKEKEDVVQTENAVAKDYNDIQPSQGTSNYLEDKKTYIPQNEKLAKKKSSVGMSQSKQMPAAQNAKELSYPPQNDNNNYNQQGNNQTYSQEEAVIGSTKSLQSPYDQAMQLYNAGDFKESISYFEKALKTASGVQKEDIQYQLAQAYLKSGKSRKANQLFEQLANGTKYKTEASQQLLKARK